ncbi:hypothetical protein ABKW28_12905 [Nocardioides sp. 31GB23]|uniref:hypothetical protein n=1 Tax=Nocardioides sp. 31GB23 TaxID=3156065 RepID=UPI0032AEF7A5
MSGVRNVSRLEALETVQRRTQHEVSAAVRRGDRAELRRLLPLGQALAREIAALRPPEPVKLQRADLVGERLAELGVTSHEVKVWACERGLIEAVKRGRISRELVETYAAARPVVEPAS